MNTKGNKPARGRPKTMNRDHVLKIAVESYWADGPTGVSINEISRRAGVSKPGIYREFGNEDGLKQAALIAYQATILAPLVDVLTDDVPFGQALQALTDFVLLDHKAHGLPDGCLQVTMCRSKDDLGMLAREKCRQVPGTGPCVALNSGSKGRSQKDSSPQTYPQGRQPFILMLRSLVRWSYRNRARLRMN